MKIEIRTEKGSKIRSKNLTPGVLYGKGMDSALVQVDSAEFIKMYRAKGTSKTFEINLEGKKHIVYIKEVQSFNDNHNVKSHFDLIKVAKDDTMTSKIHLVFTNRSILERKGLTVNTVVDSIEVEYAVGFGISKLELDVADLKENDSLKVSDIIVPEGVKILDELDRTAVSISKQKEEVIEDEDSQVEEILEVESIKQDNE